MKKLIQLLIVFVFFPVLLVSANLSEVVYQGGSYCNVLPIEDEIAKSVVFSSKGETIAGIGMNHQKNEMVFDVFNLTKDTFVQYIEVFAFAEGSSTDSSIREGYFVIYDKHPSEPSAMILLQSTTNAMTNTYFTGCYRVLEENQEDTSRPIMAIRLSLFSKLEAGDYWIGFSALSDPEFGSIQTIAVTTVSGVVSGRMLHLKDGNYSSVYDGAQNIQLRLPMLIVGSEPMYPDVSPPVIKELTESSVLLVETEGYEYQIDYGEWVSGGLFSDLRPNTEYTFAQRMKENNGYLASNPSEVITVHTPKISQSEPSAPTLNRSTPTSIQLIEIRGFEYRINEQEWQSSGLFIELSPNTSYAFEQRKAETEMYAPSRISEAIAFSTLKFTPKDPMSPALASVSFDQVELIAVDGYEYRVDDKDWQPSSTFIGLEARKTYVFYQRVKESSQSYASKDSMGIEVTTFRLPSEKPPILKVVEVWETGFELERNYEIEYSLNGENWSDLSKFDGLIADREYQIYYRFSDTKTQGVPMIVQTLPSPDSIHEKPSDQNLWLYFGGVSVVLAIALSIYVSRKKINK